MSFHLGGHCRQGYWRHGFKLLGWLHEAPAWHSCIWLSYAHQPAALSKISKYISNGPLVLSTHSWPTVLVSVECNKNQIQIAPSPIIFRYQQHAVRLDTTMLPSLCLISSKQTVSSNQCLCCSTGLKLSWPKTKLQNVGAGDAPSKILIDGVPVEGVEELICLGSKQSCNGYCRPDVLRRIELACSVMNFLQRAWNCSSLSISTKIHLYTDKICFALT